MNHTIRSIVNTRVMTLILSMIVTLSSFSNHPEESYAPVTDEAKEGSSHGESSMIETITHHISDSHEIQIYHGGLFDEILMPLPVIVYSTEKGLTVAMSSAFHHGEVAVNGYKLTHHGIENIKGDHAVTLGTAFGHAHGERFYDLSLTKNVFSMLLSVVILLLLFVPMAKKYKPGVAPKGIQNLLEVLVIFVRDEIVVPNLGNKATKFLPYLLTIFFFIWVNNILGVIPFFPGSANLTGNIAFTFVMAMFTLVITNVNGNAHYWGHILWMPGVPWPLKPLLAIIELVGVLTKPFALMIRLFANITAGHIIILALALALGLASGPLVLFMDVLEMLVAFLQAYVFTMLSALFIGQAVEEHEHH